MKDIIYSDVPEYKSNIPVSFYLWTIVVLIVFLFLCLIKLDHVFLLIAGIIVVFVSFNKPKYIIEVYNDRFQLVFPSLYGQRFENTEIYYFDEISDFVFYPGSFDLKTVGIGLVTSLLGSRFRSSRYTQPHVFRYTYKKDDKTEDLELQFDYGKEGLLKGIQLVEKKLNLLKTKNPVTISNGDLSEKIKYYSNIIFLLYFLPSTVTFIK